MDGLLKNTLMYIRNTLDLDVEPVLWKTTENLPYYLRDSYRFFESEVLQTAVLLMLDDGSDENTPANIRKHLRVVREKCGNEVIYVCESMTPYNRKRLILQKVPFVVPGNQMYLPIFGIDLREHFKKLHTEISILSPAAQVVVLSHILGNKEVTLTPKRLAERFGYSAMTMTRAFNEMEAANIGMVEKKGRQRTLHFAQSGKDLWEKVLPFLRSPVRQREYVMGIDGIEETGIKAGLSALAHYTMLAAPRAPVFALTRAKWKNVNTDYRMQSLPKNEPGGIEIEVWGYDPSLIAKANLVDPLSLYLSLQDEKDERVEAALDEMMKGIIW